MEAPEKKEGGGSPPSPTLYLGPLSGADDLQELVERVSELIGNPLTIETPDHRLLAYSRHPFEADPARRLTILNKRVPDAVARALADTGVLERVNSSPYPVRVPPVAEVGLSGRVAMAVRVGDSVRAHIWVQEVERPLSDDDLRVLEHAAALVAVQLLRLDHRREARQRTVSEFLWGLLTARSVDIPRVRQQAEDLALKLPSPYRVLAVDLAAAGGQKRVGPPGSRDDDSAGLRQAKRLLLELVQNEALRLGLAALAAPSNDGAVVLTQADQEDACSLAERLCRVGAVRGMAISVLAGRPYDALDALSEAYEEVQRCAHVVQALGLRGRVVYAEELGVLQHLPLLAGQALSGTRANHGLLQKLDHLQASKTLNFSPLETLEVFLDSGANAHAAADRLAVHVNTMHYRLRRIAEETGVDLSDGIQRLAVHLELKLRRFAAKQ